MERDSTTGPPFSSVHRFHRSLEFEAITDQDKLTKQALSNKRTGFKGNDKDANIEHILLNMFRYVSKGECGAGLQAPPTLTTASS
jgi:hypothetical protein